MIFSIIAEPGGVMQDISVALPPGVSSRDPEVRYGMVAAVRLYTRYLRERYLSASAGDGTWAPTALKGRTVRLNLARRPRARFMVSTGILIRTGRLLGSMFEGGEGHLEDFVGAGTGDVVVGTSVPYALFHQFGTSRMPARPIFVPPDLTTANEMERELQQGAVRAYEQYIRKLGGAA